MRVLSMDEFAAYANTQIEMANQIQAGHWPGTNGWCSCGKQLPCTVPAHATATRDRYRLALPDATQVLPVLAPTPVVSARSVPLWRRLLGGPR